MQSRTHAVCSGIRICTKHIFFRSMCVSECNTDKRNFMCLFIYIYINIYVKIWTPKNLCRSSLNNRMYSTPWKKRSVYFVISAAMSAHNIGTKIIPIGSMHGKFTYIRVILFGPVLGFIFQHHGAYGI